MVGPTVVRAMAARLLGVSQTALDRWIVAGEVPVVVGRAGRTEVPLHALVELVEAVRERVRAGGARHPLAAVLGERRAAAERLQSETLMSHGRGGTHGGGHRGAELRGLAYHRAVAGRLDEEIVQDARERLERWREQGRIDPRYADRWEEVLGWPPERIVKLLRQDGGRATELRQSSPFAGTLTEPERRLVLAAVASASA